MTLLGFRVLKSIEWLRLHRWMVVIVIASIEILVSLLDYVVNNDIPVTQLHWISIILAAAVFDFPGAEVVAISSTILFYLANYYSRGRSLDWAALPGVLLTLLLFTLVALAALLIIRLLTSLESSNKELSERLRQLQASTARIELLTAERERNRLARELHDGVAKTLFGVQYAAGVVEKLLESQPAQTEAALQQVRFIQQVCRNEGQSVRDIILDLRRGYEEPLFKLVAEYLRRWQLAYDQLVEFKTEGSEAAISPSMAYEVMAILEEAMENIHRHSQATRIQVEARITDEQNLVLEVQDNGVGLRGEIAERLGAIGYPGIITGVTPIIDQSGNPHFGLTGMVERASWMDGKLELAPALENGLSVKVCMPVR